MARDEDLLAAAIARAQETTPRPTERMGTVAQPPASDGTVSVRLDGDSMPSTCERVGSDTLTTGARVLVVLFPPHGAFVLGLLNAADAAVGVSDSFVYLVHADADSATFSGATQRTVPFDTADYTRPGFTPTLASGEVQLGELNSFVARWDVTSNRPNPSGSRTIVQTWLEYESNGGGFNEVDGTRSSVYLRTTDHPMTASGRGYVVATNTADKIRVRGVTTVGSGTALFQADGCRLELTRLST